MNQQYTVAIIGLGAFSLVHAKAYAAIAGARVVAACDIDPTRQASWVRQVEAFLPVHRIRFYDSAERLLDEQRPNLVSIVTKHDQHAALTILCARAGVKGILCEKPVSTDLASADLVVESCSASGSKLAIGHQRRFDPEWQAGLNLIRAGTIGKVLFAVSRWPDNKKVRHYRLAELGGGPLMWLSVHSVDLLRYFLGDVARVTGQVDRGKGAVDTETQAYAILWFQSGAQATVECGPGIGPEITSEHSIMFYGERGAVEICDGLGTRYRTVSQPRWQEVPLDPSLLPWPQRSHNSCVAEIRDLIQCIETGGEPRCSGEDGRAALEVIMAIYESERTGGPVQLPLANRQSPLNQMNREGRFGQMAWQPKSS